MSCRDDRPIPAPWKRRLGIGNALGWIALLALDFAWLRSDRLPILPLLGLLAIVVAFLWRYVPAGWDRLGYYLALVAYPVLLVLLLIGKGGQFGLWFALP